MNRHSHSSHENNCPKAFPKTAQEDYHLKYIFFKFKINVTYYATREKLIFVFSESLHITMLHTAWEITTTVLSKNTCLNMWMYRILLGVFNLWSCFLRKVQVKSLKAWKAKLTSSGSWKSRKKRKKKKHLRVPISQQMQDVSNKK